MNCYTCGNTTIKVWATYSEQFCSYIWVVECGNGHVLMPIPGNVYTIEDFDAELRALLEGEGV